MELRYDEDFVEAAVFLCTSGRRSGVPSLQIPRFHREREKLYGILDPDERNAAFFRLHLSWFREWGLETLIQEVLAEYPLLARELNVLAVRKTRGKNDEGAELYVNEAGRRSAILSLRAEAFSRDAALQDYLRHEFMHLRDMVDPMFGYSPTLDLAGLNVAQYRLARERYRLLWDAAIDGRLCAAGRTPSRSREQHAEAFARSYPFWPEGEQARIFESLWRNPTYRHADFLALIADPRGLRDAHRPEPGASCPLCGFSTFAWGGADKLAPEMTAAIVAEFPAWTADQGLCARCEEAYREAALHRAPGSSLSDKQPGSAILDAP